MCKSHWSAGRTKLVLVTLLDPATNHPGNGRLLEDLAMMWMLVSILTLRLNDSE